LNLRILPDVGAGALPYSLHDGGVVALVSRTPETDESPPEAHAAHGSTAETDSLHLDRLAQVGRLTAGILHELNQPATFVISSQTELLRLLGEIERELDTERASALAREAAGLVRETVAEMQRLRLLATRVRDYARPAAATPSAVDVNDVVSSACAITRHELALCGGVSILLGPPARIVCDPLALTQVVVNLLLNAADAVLERRDGPRSVRISTRSLADRTEIEIEDDGIGIPAEIGDRVFEPFFTTKAERGSGLGLWVSAGFVRSLGGSIRFESAPGSGTRFVVRLPKTPSDH
jgi:signal transduction histidine kinase